MSNISTTTIAPIVANLNIARAGIQRYGQPILFSVGILGCFLNILIFLRPSMRQNSCAIYFHASSWANLLCLCWGVLASMLAFFTGNNPASYNVVYCRIRFYMINFPQYASRAFVVLACLDRFLLCSTSVRQRQFCRANVAKRMVLLATFVCACLPIYILITYGPVNKLRPCMVTTDVGYVWEAVTAYMCTFIIPTVSMSILSWLTVRRLRQSAQRVGRDKITVTGKDTQLIGMLIAQVILYFITNMPYISLLLYGTFTANVLDSSKPTYRVAVENFASTLLASFFYYCFNGWPFFVYTLTAPSFRRELFVILTPRMPHQTSSNTRQQNIDYIHRIAPMTN
ncbi:unnamed protein product [Adineta ricciae]|uniref:G-protein coupled receptors family 1 profile domain-containing protein n=1 Tax=Adineta ricciae TaxID=249248 RepID=A0A814F555_ADIRI|nr:unnamed protein product [Adineta ricciae]CAF1242613.1 unnamed protein product [Adineta ricciae]